MRGVFCGLVAVFFAGAVWGLEAPVYIYGFDNMRQRNHNHRLAAQGLRQGDGVAALEPLTSADESVLSAEVAAFKRGTGIDHKKTGIAIPKKWVAGCACLKQHNELIGEIIALERSETKENLAEVEGEIVIKYGAVRANYEVHKTTCPQRKKILWTPATTKH
jgi:hypothetical protein